MPVNQNSHVKGGRFLSSAIGSTRAGTSMGMSPANFGAANANYNLPQAASTMISGFDSVPKRSRVNQSAMGGYGMGET
jgi:hypothetical protein